MSMENPYAKKYRIDIASAAPPIPNQGKAVGSIDERRLGEESARVAIHRISLLPPYISREVAIQIIKEGFGL